MASTTMQSDMFPHPELAVLVAAFIMHTEAAYDATACIANT